MKKALVSLALLTSVISSDAQGIITFFSLNPIMRPDGTTGVGEGFTAGLFLASDRNTPLGTTDFVPHSGYLNAIDITVPGFGVGSSPTFVVRIWETGKTYSTSSIFGEHAPFVAGPLGGPQPPNPPAIPPDLGPNFVSSGLTLIPEPSTYALAALGLGTLAIMRRRK